MHLLTSTLSCHKNQCLIAEEHKWRGNTEYPGVLANLVCLTELNWHLLLTKGSYCNNIVEERV